MARRQEQAAGPRAAMIDSAVALIREQGVAATSFADVLARSGAPRGSVYHHFPRGKSQLVEEATESAATRIGRAVARILDSGDTVSALRALVDLWRNGLEASGYAAGCPLAAAALGTEPSAREVAGVAFTELCELIAASLVTDGVPVARSASLSALVVSALEGALVVAQAQGTSAPLDAVVDELEILLGA